MILSCVYFLFSYEQEYLLHFQGLNYVMINYLGHRKDLKQDNFKILQPNTQQIEQVGRLCRKVIGRDSQHIRQKAKKGNIGS